MGAAVNTKHNELDYNSYLQQVDANGYPTFTRTTHPVPTGAGNSFSGTLGSSCFTAAIDLETSSGIEISGMNAEEQSDITFMAQWSMPQQDNFVYEIYAYVDQMIVIRSNNMLEVIQ
jgi:hypothetical protein